MSVPRATCHVCGRSVTVRVTGQLRVHRLIGRRRAMPGCAGSGQWPQLPLPMSER